MNKFLLFLSLISIFGYSQNNFKESAVVFKNGTIKNGFVNYVKTRNTPQEFKYKSSIEGKIETLDSTEVVSVSISDITKFIFKKNIEVSFDSNEFSPTDNKIINLDRFIEVVVDGEYSFSNYSDSQYEKYYYFGNDSILKPLKIKRFYNSEGNLVTVEEYKTELITNLANENPEIIKEIKKTRLKISDLSKLFYIINKKDLAVLKAKNNDGFVNINLSSDINFIKYKEFNVDFSNKTIMNIGGEIEYMLPYYNNLFALELVPSFNIYKDDGIYNGNPIYQYGDIQNVTAIYYSDPNNGRKVYIKSTTFSMPFNLKIYPINKKVKIYTSFTLFNLFSAGKGKMNFEKEASFEPDLVPPFYGFFEIGGSYKKIGFSFKKLKKFESSSQYFGGYAFTLKYNLYSSKK